MIRGRLESIGSWSMGCSIGAIHRDNAAQHAGECFRASACVVLIRSSARRPASNGMVGGLDGGFLHRPPG